MSCTDIEALWDLIGELGMSTRLCVSGFFLYRLLNDFAPGRHTAARGAILYTCVLLVLFWIPPEVPVPFLSAYGTATAAAALSVCRGAPDGQRRFIVFLCITYYALREIAVTIAGSIYGALYQITVMQAAALNRPAYQTAIFVACSATYTALLAAGLAFIVRAIRRAYPVRRTRLNRREFWLLIMPSLSAAAASEVLAGLRYPLTSVGSYAAASFYSDLVLAVLFAVILGTVVLFAQITEEQRERRRQETLAVQTADIRWYVSELEGLYERLRSFRHDVANHLETLSALEMTGSSQAAAAYADSARQRLADALPSVQSGDPVTDVILSSLQIEAEQQHIRFTSRFRFPVGADPFDIGIILHNAGANALRGAAQAAEPFISIRSWRHRRTFMIECANSCAPDFWCDGTREGPPTDKDDGAHHGIGLGNIRSVADRYSGRCEIEAANGICILSVMLLLFQSDS